MRSKNVAMIPARLGSQRLKKKNLEKFGELTLIEYAIERCLHANIFDEIYVNSESKVFEKFAEKRGVNFYHRPPSLGGNKATSEEFVEDFLNNIQCVSLYQIHSITPLMNSQQIRDFVIFSERNKHYNTVLSCVEDQIEVAYQGHPVNFSFNSKTNSQNLNPTQRITWAATKWDRDTYLLANQGDGIGTYSGNIGFFSVGTYSGLAIKTIEDLKIANALRELI
jgi:CMP-N-acetylneuraminic acid synthetase